jgi:hypothetical protein
MTYLINGIPVIENNANATFNSLQVTGGSIFLPDSNPTRNTVGFKLSTQTNIDTSGRGVHGNVTIDGGTQSNFAIVGSVKSYGFAAGGMSTHNSAFRDDLKGDSLPFQGAQQGVHQITKWSFANESSSTLFNSLTRAITHAVGVSSPTNGYAISGFNIIGMRAVPQPGIGPIPGDQQLNNSYFSVPRFLPGFSMNPSFTEMQKFSFATETLTTTINNPVLAGQGASGFQDQTKGFKFSGYPVFVQSLLMGPALAPSGMFQFPFANDAVASTGVTSPTGAVYAGNVNGKENGYIVGGMQATAAVPGGTEWYTYGSVRTSTVLKFSYSTYAYSVTMPNTYPFNSTLYAYMPAHASPTHGYVTGGIFIDLYGQTPATAPNPDISLWAKYSTEMRKFAFASDTSSVTYATLASRLEDKYAYYSTESNGYIDVRLSPQMAYPTSVPSNVIPLIPSDTVYNTYTKTKQRLKFPFATDTTAVENGGQLYYGLAGSTGHEGG